MKHFIVINPHSLGKKESLEKVQRDIQNAFLSYPNMEYHIHLSRYPRDAVAVVHRYLLTVPVEETVRIYAVGGDGILFDCLNGMVKFPNAELTSMPYGNANDFVRAFGEDAAPIFRDIKNLITAPARAVDVINCGSNYALIEANVGLVGQTIFLANSILRGTKNKWVRPLAAQVYVFSGMAAITKHEIIQQQYTMLLDDEEISGHYANIHIANIACDGASFVPSPYAKPNDGILDVIFIAANSSLKMLKMINDRNSGKFEKSGLFVYKKCKSVKITSDTQLSIQMDGEAFYAKDFSLKIVPAGIKFFAPVGLNFADYSYRAYKKNAMSVAPFNADEQNSPPQKEEHQTNERNR